MGAQRRFFDFSGQTFDSCHKWSRNVMPFLIRFIALTATKHGVINCAVSTRKILVVLRGSSQIMRQNIRRPV